MTPIFFSSLTLPSNISPFCKILTGSFTHIFLLCLVSINNKCFNHSKSTLWVLNKVAQIQTYSMYHLNMHAGLLSCFSPLFLYYHIQLWWKFWATLFANVLVCSYFSSLKHTRPLLKAGFLFLLLECNSSICRPSVFPAHLLLLSEIIANLIMLHSFARFR